MGKEDEAKELIGNNSQIEDVNIDDLLFADLLRPFSDTIGKHFEGRKAVVYRALPNPATPESMYPRKLRKYETLAEVIDGYEKPSPEGLTDEDQLRLVNQHYGTSVFTNEDGLRAMWEKSYSTKTTTSEKNRYVRDMGDSIVRLIIDGISSGALQKEIRERDGHLNFLQSKSFVIEDHIDREYGINGYKPLIIKDDE
ncbi:MAG: hypothetical protein MJY88_03415 [Bacteroidales bacterium]|nr:hypothetical protein [Bacteroidales bacterium]